MAEIQKTEDYCFVPIEIKLTSLAEVISIFGCLYHYLKDHYRQEDKILRLISYRFKGGADLTEQDIDKATKKVFSCLDSFFRGENMFNCKGESKFKFDPLRGDENE